MKATPTTYTANCVRCRLTISDIDTEDIQWQSAFQTNFATNYQELKPFVKCPMCKELAALNEKLTHPSIAWY